MGGSLDVKLWFSVVDKGLSWVDRFLVVLVNVMSSLLRISSLMGHGHAVRQRRLVP